MLLDRTNRFATGLLAVYARRLLCRHFHSVRVDGVPFFTDELQPSANQPLIFYGNHYSWWDGFFLFLLGKHYGLNMRVMMEEQNLRRYPFFRYTGAFGINLDDERSRGQSLLHAARFLRDDSQGPRALLIYPHGRLVSPLEKEWPPFKPGLEALLRLCPKARALPISHEIVPGKYPRPEVYLEVGEAFSAEQRPSLSELENGLWQTRTALIEKALGEPSKDMFYLREPAKGLHKLTKPGKPSSVWTLPESTSPSSAVATWAKQ